MIYMVGCHNVHCMYRMAQEIGTIVLYALTFPNINGAVNDAL